MCTYSVPSVHLVATGVPGKCPGYLQSQALDGSISSRFIVLYMSGYSRTEHLKGHRGTTLNSSGLVQEKHQSLYYLL